MKLKFLTLFLAFSMAGCSVSLVPEYSATLEQQITTGSKMNDKLYLDLLNAEPDARNFQDFAKQYSEVEAEINSIRLKNEIRKNNADMLKTIDNLRTAFITYKNEHKAKKPPLTDGEIIIYNSTIKGFWLPLLTAESGLKKQKKITP